MLSDAVVSASRNPSISTLVSFPSWLVSSSSKNCLTCRSETVLSARRIAVLNSLRLMSPDPSASSVENINSAQDTLPSRFSSIPEKSCSICSSVIMGNLLRASLRSSSIVMSPDPSVSILPNILSIIVLNFTLDFAASLAAFSASLARSASLALAARWAWMARRAACSSSGIRVSSPGIRLSNRLDSEISSSCGIVDARVKSDVCVGRDRKSSRFSSAEDTFVCPRNTPRSFTSAPSSSLANGARIRPGGPPRRGLISFRVSG